LDCLFNEVGIMTTYQIVMWALDIVSVLGAIGAVGIGSS